MHTGARRSAGPTRARHEARLTARATPPPAAEHAEAVTPPSAVSPGTAVRGDALGATLARAVAQRAHGSAAMAGQAGATLQRFLGIGKKKKPPRPTQALPAPPRPKQALPAPARPKQALPAAAAPQTQSLFEARQFDMDPFEARQFNLDEAPAAAPPPPAAQPQAAAAVASAYGSRDLDDGYAPELVPDASGLVPVAGDPYLEWLVSSFASDRGTVTGPRSYGALRNLQVIASLKGYPKPRPIDEKYLATSSTAYDWGFAY